MTKITNQGTATKKTVLIDFDGVIHSYKSGWKGVDVIPDPPLPGAIEWLCRMMELFDARIFSARCNDPAGVAAMRSWLGAHGMPLSYLALLKFEPGKPSAHLIIDDRAMPFAGEFPVMKAVRDFTPWYYGEDGWNR